VVTPTRADPRGVDGLSVAHLRGLLARGRTAELTCARPPLRWLAAGPNLPLHQRAQVVPPG